MCSQTAVNDKWETINLTSEETIKRNIKHIEYYFKNYNNTKKIKLLLENSASDGSKIGGTMLEFGKVFKPLYKKYGNKIGTCIDTCHTFASGYSINTIEGVNFFLDDYKKNVGDFSLNAEKNLVFTPSDSVNYLTDSFGLTTYVSPAIKREVLQQVEEKQEEKDNPQSNYGSK